MDDQLQLLVERSRAAWKAVWDARNAAEAADEAVKTFMFGKQVVISGSSTRYVDGGTMVRRWEQFVEEPAFVKSVFFYRDQDGRPVDAFRAVTSDGVEREFPVTGTEVALAPAEAAQ